MEVLRLIRVDFDTMENSISAAVVRKEIGLFGDEPAKTAAAKVEDALKRLGAVQPYLGWDRQVYPQFLVETTHVS